MRYVRLLILSFYTIRESSFSTTEDVVIISSGSESTSEETIGNGNELNEVYGDRRQLRRKRSICQTCGMYKFVIKTNNVTG